MNYARRAAAHSFLTGAKRVEAVQAFILLALYPQPVVKWEVRSPLLSCDLENDLRCGERLIGGLGGARLIVKFDGTPAEVDRARRPDLEKAGLWVFVYA